jgi:hypothetical protein
LNDARKDCPGEFWFYGQVNKGVLFYNDGHSTLGHFPVDNDSSSTRFGMKSLHDAGNVGIVGTNVEAEWEPFSTGFVSQTTRGEWDSQTFLLRKAEVYVTNEDLGKIWLGQGSMASDGTAETDLSGTTLAGYSSVAAIAGAQLFRMPNGVLSSMEVKSAFRNLDGVGRKFRVRYDTPSLNGWTLSASVGQQVVPERTHAMAWDVSTKYEKKTELMHLKGGLAFSKPDSDHRGVVDGSVSVLDLVSGVSVTLAGGIEFLDDRDQKYVYAKVGKQVQHWNFGDTFVSADVYVGADFSLPGSESLSYGVQVVQALDDWNTELYGGFRIYHYSEPTAAYQRGTAAIAGARSKF